jgi:hypothetical protein
MLGYCAIGGLEKDAGAEFYTLVILNVSKNEEK